MTIPRCMGLGWHRSFYEFGEIMKKIVFIEGVSGVGKTTAVKILERQLRHRDYKVKAHFEGDADSPLDLCWTAYLTPMEYQEMLSHNPDWKIQFNNNTIYRGDYFLVRYRVDRIPLYTDEIDQYLHSKEFCFNPKNVLPLSVFTAVFCDLWTDYKNVCAEDLDYELFDASLVSHMTNDLVRNYNASQPELVGHLNALLEIIKGFEPMVFYLYSDDVSRRVAEARNSRGQTPLTETQVQFWEMRMRLDMQVLPDIQAEVHYVDISQKNWNEALADIIEKLT